MKYKLIIFLVLSVNITFVLCKFQSISLSSSKFVDWNLENNNGSIKLPATVPGGIYTDLKKEGVIGDILYGFNDVLTRWVAYDNWTYTCNFEVTESHLISEKIHLVFHGVDTIAYFLLNDIPIGNSVNMFVKNTFDVKNKLKLGKNELKVQFTSPVKMAKVRSDKHFAPPQCVPDVYNGECHANQLRKMQASFSWDWGPAFPSVGIWKPVEILFYDGAIITAVSTQKFLKNGQWEMNITAHIESGQKRIHLNGFLSAEIKLNANFTYKVSRHVNLETDDYGITEVSIPMNIQEDMISVWWPNGYGNQPLYLLNVFLSIKGVRDEVSQKQIQIGFRSVELIQEEASMIFGNSTAGKGLTFYFKINNYPLFMKGSNWIPSNILPESSTDKDTVDSLLMAAKVSHMSMLRVWGGGFYESDYFYEKCDQLGILIWQDLLFACAMYPTDPDFLKNVKTEVEQNVIRLQHHACIANWAGNNENEVALSGNWYGTNSNYTKYKEEYVKLYVDTIKPIINSLDPGRTYLVSSPTNGKESEREGYVSKNPYDPHYGDTHYYNYIADNWDLNIYPSTRFASEYGFQSFPSFQTMNTATKNNSDFKIDSDFIKHRQHSPGGTLAIQQQINKHFKLNEEDEKYFEKFIFQSQITQAMAMKAETEFYRQSQATWYTMGALFWQLNDVWQAPSWSGIEYGGKWKMLQYYSKSFFAPVLVSPRMLSSGDIDVYLLNDRFVPITQGEIIVSLHNWSSLIPMKTKTFPAVVDSLSSKLQFHIGIDSDIWNLTLRNDHFLKFHLKAEGVQSSPFNFVFPKSLKNADLQTPKITIQVSKNMFGNSRVDVFEYTVDVKFDCVVLFFWLEADGLDGYFEENGFIITQQYLRVNYISKLRIDPTELRKKITYQYYSN